MDRDRTRVVRIWDTVNKEHNLKNEFQTNSGPIEDQAGQVQRQPEDCGGGEERTTQGEGWSCVPGRHLHWQLREDRRDPLTPATRKWVKYFLCGEFEIFCCSQADRIETGSEDNTATDHFRFCEVVRYSPGLVAASMARYYSMTARTLS